MSPRTSTRDTSWVNLLGLLLLLICYVGAIWNVVGINRRENRENVIRLVHWQLELGVRDGIQELIESFEAAQAAKGNSVKVVQIPIPERVYQQYVTTQLIGGSAPDMIQLGMFPTEYLGRFFYPLSKTLRQPNPYLSARLEELRAVEDPTPGQLREIGVLESLAPRPWLDGFMDGLRSQYRSEFQEYFGVGFSTFTVRMYYNRDLYREVLGHDRPPSSFQELLENCRAIEAYAAEPGRDLVPIASSRYQVNVFRERYLAELTSDLARDLDVGFSGEADGFETLAGMLGGGFTPWNPQYRAATEILLELARYFPKGFMSLGREDSGFSFVQGRAAMITSGSWDALSYLKKIQDQPEDRRFEVGIFDFPSISPQHPEYGPYADGRASEANAGTGFAFGITRFTRQFDLCVEFLQFATTPDMNTRLNQQAGWIPVVKGAVPRDMLRNFLPNDVGSFGSTEFEVMSEGKAVVLESQLFWPLVSGAMPYDTYADKLWRQLPTAAATDYKRMYSGSRESLPNRELRSSAYLANVAFDRLGEQEQELPEREVQLLRSLQPLQQTQNTAPLADHLMRETLRREPDDPRVRAFRDAFLREVGRIMDPESAPRIPEG